VTAVSAKLQRQALRRLSVSTWTFVLAGFGLAGLAIRIWVYRSNVSVPDGDEGVVGLTARHILDGQFPSFIWGLKYGGIQECLIAAGLFLIFGSSWLALRLVPMALWTVTAFLVWRIGRRTLGEPGATLAGVLYWVWPPYLYYQLLHEHGYYASDVFYCALFILLALRVVEQPTTRRVAVFGLAAGLGFWQTSQAVPVLVPVILWTVWRQRQALRGLWAAVPLAVLGALPWLIWNAKHDWASLNLSYPAHSTYLHRLRTFVSPLLPMEMGIRQYWTQSRILPAALTYLVLLILAGLFLWGLWKAVRSPRSNQSLVWFVAIVFPFIYAISEWTIESSDPRYVVPYTPVLVLLLGQLATTRLRGTILLALGTAASVAVMHNAIGLNSGPAKDPPRDFRPLTAELDRLGVHYIYSEHWVVYRLAFETREHIIGAKNEWGPVHWNGTQAEATPDAYIRYPPWERATAEHRHAFVFYRDQVPAIAAQLRKFGYHAYDVGSLVVYWLPQFVPGSASPA
jgi:hypothetical protein